MTSNPPADADTSKQTSSASLPADGPSFLGPNNAISGEVPSRSQSPAKRLKSEEPPTTILPGTLDEPDPMVVDTPQPSCSRGQSVDMLDAVESLVSTDAKSDQEPSVTLSTSLDDAPPTTDSTGIVPSPEEQVRMVIEAKNSEMKEGVEWFIIAGTWLNRFLAQDSQYQAGLSKEELEKPIGPIDNNSIVDTELREGLQSSDPSDDQAKFVPVKVGQLGEDYEILPEQAWNKLVSWYGLAKDSPTIKRTACNTNEDSDGQKNIQVEISLPTFTVHKIRDLGANVSKDSLQKEKQQKPQKIVAGRSTGFQKFLQRLKTLAGIDDGRKVRVWKVEQPDNYSSEASSSKSGKSVFERMVLDVTAFAEANRALIPVPDQTQNSKYNGNMKIGTAGLGTGGTIVLEEQTTDGEWPSEASTTIKKKFGESMTVLKNGLKSANTAKKKLPLASPRSSSPSKNIIKPNTSNSSSIFTRSRERRDSRQMGTCGLGNLGNTCYMNSALQCLRGVEELSKYFLSGEYTKELNPSNPLSHNGNVAKAYAKLLQNIFAPNSPSSILPREFKSVIGRYAASFSGYQQQDTQEFLAFLLDGLHEDLNRIVKKPYINKPDSEDHMVGDPEKISKLAEEHWSIYKQRNDSAITDLFTGLYKSTLVCPTCDKVSITFDPFMDLTLPLPIQSFWTHNIIFFPKNNSQHKTPVTVPVELPKHASIGNLVEHLAKKLNVDPQKLIGSEVYKNKFYKHYDVLSDQASSIATNDEAVFYELDEVPTNWRAHVHKRNRGSMLTINNRYDDEVEELASDTEQLVVPVILKRDKAARRYLEDIFGIPFFIVLNREEQNSYEAIVEKIVEKLQILTTRDLYEDMPEQDGFADDEDGSSVENVKAPVTKERCDVEKDGFVDVTMKDTVSITDSDESEKPQKRTIRRKVPPQLMEAFDLKILGSKNSERVPTGWNNLEIVGSILERRSPTPSNRRLPSQFTEFGLQGGSGHITPRSNHSEEEYDDAPDQFPEVPEGHEPPMQDSSGDEEDNAAFSNQVSFNNTIPADNFYSNNSETSSGIALKTSFRSDSPPVETGPQSLIRFGEGIVMNFTDQGFDALFGGRHPDDFQGRGNWDAKHFSSFEDPEIEAARRRREERKSKGITLEDCLDEFAKEEVLSEDDPWYCPRCEKHQRASKKFELWKCPDILVIHLKRFSSSRSFRDKIDVQIQCPMEGLNLGKRVGNGNTENKEHIYDLFAVDNHFGGLGGGHYTAHVKNWYDGNWYYCDDGSVRSATASSVVSPAAYLLFYRRRSDKPLGGPEFERIHSDVAKQLQEQQNDEDNSEDDREFVSREQTPEPNSFIGPILPAMRFEKKVGNKTLWGDSKPVSTDEELPVYTDRTQTYIPPSDDEGIDDSDKEMMVVSPLLADDDNSEDVAEVRLSVPMDEYP
ncbi:hypothetical protein EDC01DRAFT_754853 [Geopyxis carbonaria]|nr:hypothetical protein EDC01DRAFT_754853 [Geopyxis carbonaria]